MTTKTMICIDNSSGYAGLLTVGKAYEVADEDKYYAFRNDAGAYSSAFKHRFAPPSVAREVPAWDSTTRGPQMSTATGKVIHKYQMPVLEEFEMTLPSGANILRMEDQGGMFWLWAVVDTRHPLETRKFRAFKTGAKIPDSFDGKYLGFCKIHVQQELGLYIFEDVAS